MRNLRELDLNLLRTLDALLDERNVTRAAERLSLTQPAVSGMLTRLRESFDDPLFVRTQRGIVPTLRALELATPIKQILSDIQEMLQPSVFEPATHPLTLSIAATDYGLSTIIVPFLSMLRTEAPGIRLSVRTINHDTINASLESGELDLALMTPEETAPGMHARRLYDEHYVCALREDHPDAQSDKISLERFCELDHALVSYSGNDFTGITDLVLKQRGCRRNVVFSVASFLILPDVLRNSDMITVVPGRLLADTPGIRLLPPPINIPGFTKTAAWHERTHRDPAHRWIRERLFSVCAEKTLHCREKIPAAETVTEDETATASAILFD